MTVSWLSSQGLWFWVFFFNVFIYKFFIFFFHFWLPCGIWSPQARDPILAVVVTYTAGAAMPDPLLPQAPV